MELESYKEGALPLTFSFQLMDPRGESTVCYVPPRSFGCIISDNSTTLIRCDPIL